MLLKAILCVCVQAVFYKTAYTQCLPPPSLPPGTPLAPGAPLPNAPLALGPGAPLAPGVPFMPGGPLLPGGTLPCNGPFFEEYIGLPPIGPFYGRVIGGEIIVDTSAQYTPIGPAGVSIHSDDLYIRGPVLVTGKLPFLGTVVFEGTVPAAGTSAVSYECGTENIGIVENIGPVVTGPVYDSLALPGGLQSCSNVGLL